MPNETITGKIYPVWNADKTERRFPQTVIEAVLGLPTYLQDQFSALADIYMPIEGITESETGQEFVYRKSAATIKAKSLTLDRIYGKTLAWNQICQDPFGTDINKWSGGTRSLSGGHVHCALATAGWGEIRSTAQDSIIIGHKYYIVGKTYQTAGQSNGKIMMEHPITASSPTVIENGDYRTFVGFGVATRTNLLFQKTARGLSGIEFDILGLEVHDLTLMFGAGNEPTTVEEFEAMFPGYHDYSDGKLISNDTSALETVGFNLWDEEWELGSLTSTDGSKTSSTTQIRSKNYIPVFPNTTYYRKNPYSDAGAGHLNRAAFYDANKQYLGGGSAGGWIAFDGNETFTTPANAAYMLFYVDATTYANNICVNLSDPAKNGTYEPYRKTTMQLGLNSIKVKSHNIWDEEWETNSNELWSKNFIPVTQGKTYYIKCGAYTTSQSGYVIVYGYDAQKTLISANSGVLANKVGEFIVPAGVSYIKFDVTSLYGSTYNHDICINVSSAFNGQYEPHGDIAITGGLKSAGSVRDEIVGNKYIKRVGSVDLGTLDWTYYQDGQCFLTNNPAGMRTQYDELCDGLVCSKYSGISGPYWSDAEDKQIGATGSNLRVYDSAYTDAATFKTAMSGVMLFYELATPIEYELVEPLVYSMAAGTTEARISPNADDLSAPFCCDMTYDANANNDSANAQYALTAGRLYNTHKLWGRDFDGSNDVSGALSGVTTIGASGNITTAAQLISTVATGTAPLSVASTTEVANLHSYTATKLHTQRTLWGQNFDGSGNVTGDMSSVGNIAFSASGKNIASLLYFDTTNSRVGVGTSSPAYKLDVNGTLNASGNTTLGGTLGVIGNTTIGGTFTVGTSSVNKATTLYGALTASGAVSFTSTLGVTGLSTLAGGIKLTTTKKIWFGDAYYIELDDNNNLHTNAGFYSNSFITAGGVGSGSGGGSNLVKERAYDISLTQIASSDYAELIRSPYITDSESGFMFAYSPAFLDTASQMHDYVIDAIGHEIGSCDIQWIGIAIGSTYTDVGVFDSGAFLVLAKSGNTYYWYEFEV